MATRSTRSTCLQCGVATQNQALRCTRCKARNRRPTPATTTLQIVVMDSPYDFPAPAEKWYVGAMPLNDATFQQWTPVNVSHRVKGL